MIRILYLATTHPSNVNSLGDAVISEQTTCISTQFSV